jgi:hypothetical protein
MCDELKDRVVAERTAIEVARDLLLVIASPVQAGKAEALLVQHCPLPGAAIPVTDADCADTTVCLCSCCLGKPPANIGPATPASTTTAIPLQRKRIKTFQTSRTKKEDPQKKKKKNSGSSVAAAS